MIESRRSRKGIPNKNKIVLEYHGYLRGLGKQCKRCGILKPAEDFWVRRCRVDGRDCVCKRCKAVYEHSDQRHKVKRARYQRKRAEILAHLKVWRQRTLPRRLQLERAWRLNHKLRLLDKAEAYKRSRRGRLIVMIGSLRRRAPVPKDYTFIVDKYNYWSRTYRNMHKSWVASGYNIELTPSFKYSGEMNEPFNIQKLSLVTWGSYNFNKPRSGSRWVSQTQTNKQLEA